MSRIIDVTRRVSTTRLLRMVDVTDVSKLEDHDVHNAPWETLRYELAPEDAVIPENALLCAVGVTLNRSGSYEIDGYDWYMESQFGPIGEGPLGMFLDGYKLPLRVMLRKGHRISFKVSGRPGWGGGCLLPVGVPGFGVYLIGERQMDIL